MFLPGTFGMAEDYVPEMSALAPRRCVAVSLRGRGRSDVPELGYSFEDHVRDFDTIVAESGLDRFCLMAYSMGAAYAIGYAARNAARLAGLIIGDYPARYRALAPAWVGRALTALPDRAKPAVARALQRESSEVVLWERLAEIRCPVLILRGGQAGVLVTDEIAAMYRRHLTRARLVTLPAAGHELWQPDFDAYVGAVRSFVEQLDAAAN